MVTSDARYCWLRYEGAGYELETRTPNHHRRRSCLRPSQHGFGTVVPLPAIRCDSGREQRIAGWNIAERDSAGSDLAVAAFPGSAGVLFWNFQPTSRRLANPLDRTGHDGHLCKRIDVLIRFRFRFSPHLEFKLGFKLKSTLRPILWDVRRIPRP